MPRLSVPVPPRPCRLRGRGFARRDGADPEMRARASVAPGAERRAQRQIPRSQPWRRWRTAHRCLPRCRPGWRHGSRPTRRCRRRCRAAHAAARTRSRGGRPVRPRRARSHASEAPSGCPHSSCWPAPRVRAQVRAGGRRWRAQARGGYYSGLASAGARLNAPELGEVLKLFPATLRQEVHRAAPHVAVCVQQRQPWRRAMPDAKQRPYPSARAGPRASTARSLLPNSTPTTRGRRRTPRAYAASSTAGEHPRHRATAAARAGYALLKSAAHA